MQTFFGALAAAVCFFSTSPAQPAGNGPDSGAKSILEAAVKSMEQKIWALRYSGRGIQFAFGQALNPDSK
jgi:hypothetical protein